MKILPCTREHVPAVVELFVGRSEDDPTGDADLCRCFEEIYFDNPWYDPELPSLVCQDASGRIHGFLGVMHRPMVFDGKPVRVAATSNFRFRRDEAAVRNPLAAIQMIKRLFQGPQDLSIADRATESGKRIWDGCGGLTVPLYSFDWVRPIRPAVALLEMAGTATQRSLPRAIWLLAQAADPIGTRIMRRYLSDRGPPYELGPLDEEAVVEALASAPGFDLRPQYEIATFRWLLEMSRRRAAGGRVHSASVRNEGGRQVGWFVYIKAKPKGRVGQVLQMQALKSHRETVLRALVRHAGEQGVALLYGAVDPTDLRPYHDTACMLDAGRRWMLVHARQPELVETFRRATALLTGLEGEWWLPPFWLGREAL